MDKKQSIARAHYQAQIQRDVIVPGLVILAECPWLGCTPDGVVLQDGVRTMLLDIKCPTKGKKENTSSAVESCAFIVKDQNGKGYRLKKKHILWSRATMHGSPQC